MKKTIYRATWEPVDVEVPERCPNPECDADFFAADSVKEIGWVMSEYPCRFEHGVVRYGDDHTDVVECQYTVAYMCAKCGDTLANGDDTVGVELELPRPERALDTAG